MSLQDADTPLAAFAEGYQRPLSASNSSEFEAWLQQTLTSARSRWPEVELSSNVYCRRLGQAAAVDGLSMTQTMELHAVDLFLASACVLAISNAAAAFDRDFLGSSVATLRRLDPSAAFADEVRQVLREKLLVSGGAAPPRIASYSGRGPLAQWVAVAAQREGLSIKRASGRLRQLAEQHAASVFSGVRDPELVYMKERYQNEFRDAFRAALFALSERDRVVLRFSLVDRLSFTKIAAMFGVNQSSVTRWVASTREQIQHHMLQFFRERLGLDRNEFESVARMVRSELELNVSQLLSEESGA
jgi:RNA polymerase sigma-70 factor, ECF subfamily